MARIEYEDKVATRSNNLPEKNQITDNNLNEIKESVNSLYDQVESIDVSGKEDVSNKDSSNGYVGLTLFKINFKNALNTFTSFFTNSNTASRTYTFQDRNGVIADDTDLAGKENSLPSKIGSALKFLRVKSDETGFEYADTSSASGIWGIPNSSGIYTYYATYALARSAASSGQTIELFADVTESGNVQNNLKDGVNINFNGHTYTLDNSGTANSFSDNNVAVNCKLSNGRIIRKSGTISETDSCTLYIDNTSTILECTGMKFETTFGFACVSEGAVFGGEYTGILGFYCRAGSVYNIVGNGTTSRGIRNLAKCVNSIGISTGSDGIYSSGTLIGCHGTSSANYGIYFEGGLALNCQGVSSAGFGAAVISDMILQGCQFYSSASYGLYAQALIYADNCSGYSTASHGMFVFNATSVLKNCSAYSTANNGMRLGNGVELHNSTVQSKVAAALHTAGKVYNSSIKCEWSNASGHGITGDTTQYTDVFNSNIIVIHASANCLHYGSAINVYYGNNSFGGATTDVNANITQAQTNTLDTYGNLKIG